MFLEPESEEHSYSPFVSLHLQVILISCYREIINRSGTGKLVAPGIDGRSPTRNDRRWKMIFHTVTNGWNLCITTPLLCFCPHLGIVVGIYRYGWQG